MARAVELQHFVEGFKYQVLYHGTWSDMARAFRCKECGTGYSTTGDDVPPSPNWADGHKCVMVEVESKLNIKTEERYGEE